MVLQQRHKKTVGGVLCALLLTMFFESSLCAAAHLEEHATADCRAHHLHNDRCDLHAASTPCSEDCSLEHRHEQVVAGSTKGSSNTTIPGLYPSTLLPALARLGAPSTSVSPHTLLLPPPELRRSTVLLI